MSGSIVHGSPRQVTTFEASWPAGSSLVCRIERIAERAYRLWKENGRVPGQYMWEPACPRPLAAGG